MPKDKKKDAAKAAPKVRSNLNRLLNRQVFYKGDKILEQGSPAYSAYYLETGRIEVYVQEGEHEVKVSEMGPGSIFGEMALIDPGDRSATVKVIEDCTVTVISKEDLEQKINSVGDVAIKALLGIMIQRLRESNTQQVHQSKSFAEFHDRVSGLIDKVSEGIDAEQRDEFREEVTPLLEKLGNLLDKYGEADKK